MRYFRPFLVLAQAALLGCASAYPGVAPLSQLCRAVLNSSFVAQLPHSTPNKPGRCGAGVGSCASSFCCSQDGRCGTTIEHCMSPKCQLEYSDSCYAGIPPRGINTTSVPRDISGSVPYGSIIKSCVTPGTIALTFDDGPMESTEIVLDVLQRHGIKATFFICGNNNPKGQIDDPSTPWTPILRRMYAEGHQLASHTWTHYDLSEISPRIRWQQVIYNEMAFRNIFGWFPTYIRPPYASCTEASGCLADLGRWGYHVVNYDIDTRDFLNDSPEKIQTSKDIFDTAVSHDAARHSYLPIAHDVKHMTATVLTEHMIQILLQRGYRAVTVGECLGDPLENWYRDASSTVNIAIPIDKSALRVSDDGICAGYTKKTCDGSTHGNCCSKFGFCGSTEEHCGTGCQVDYGTCLI